MSQLLVNYENGPIQTTLFNYFLVNYENRPIQNTLFNYFLL